MINMLNFVAMAPPAGGSGQSQQSPIFFVGWMLILMAIFFFMTITPQRRKEKERRALLDNIKTGDRVVFGAGIMGMVSNVKDKTFIVKVADSVKMEILRGSVTQVLAKDEQPAEADKK